MSKPLREQFADGDRPGWCEIDFQESRDIWRRGSFAAMIMAAYYKADSVNAAKLGREWPEIIAEFDARYNAPGGKLPGELG